MTERQKKIQRHWKKDKGPSRSQQIERERQQECKRERGEKAGWQRGHSDSEERRTWQGLVTRPTGPPLSTSWHSVVHTHTHTYTHIHTRLADGPPSCPIRNCLISCAKQPLPCQPWCHLLPNNMAADQTSTHKHTHANTQKTRSKPYTWHCPAPVTHRHTHQTLQTQV